METASGPTSISAGPRRNDQADEPVRPRPDVGEPVLAHEELPQGYEAAIKADSNGFRPEFDVRAAVRSEPDRRAGFGGLPGLTRVA